LLSSVIQKELRDASGGEPVARVRTMEEIVSRSSAAETFNALVMTIFGCSALLLAVIGIYGLIAYSMTQRTQEIGIRRALGAQSSHILNMVMFQSCGRCSQAWFAGLSPLSGSRVCSPAFCLVSSRGIPWSFLSFR
jgi:hypothetical protein